MAIENVKGSLEYSKDLQSAMASNPLKKETTSETQRQKNIQEAASKIDAKALMTSYVVEFQMNVSSTSENNFNSQNGVSLLGGSALSNPDRLTSILNGLDLNAIGYKGKPLQELTSNEAKALIAEDGFFGIAKTSARIADFVIAGAGDDVEKLKAGREGVIRGYNQAQKAWGGELPDISKETLQKSLEKIDKRLTELGVNVLEENV
ncbi:hydrogenase-4 component G [Helicobacter apodemus]|uniref:Hydrogenase-4 component G n=1 Tax=Helicobacter apodemus TaxID=135569 RepID=A0A2U8FF50_9HELI|nr:hydrogenase-4 component G [Helicobacter apodemus]AWI34910.1 hydrogenase-4 component G [Helicobacter apodemus]